VAREDSYRNRQMKLLSTKRILMFTLIVWANFTSSVCIALPVFPITPKPVGSGARALGQSAFIAVADDATAASWNPAGLINLERPEVSFVGTWRSIEKDYTVADPLVSIYPESWSDSEINFMSYAQPLQVENTDVVLSVNYHQVYDFGLEFNQKETGPVEGSEVFSVVEQEKGKSEGAVSAYTLAGGLSMPDCPEITFGLGINLYARSLHNDHVWQVKKTITDQTYYDSIPSGDPVITTIIDKFDNFRAHNFTFGLLWDAYEKKENLLTLGLVYHTPFTAKVDFDLVSYTSESVPPYPHSIERLDIVFPASLGAGVNYRFSDELSAAFDVEWKEWSKFKLEDPSSEQKSPVDENTVAYRLGFEHLSLPRGTEQSVYALRCGAFYEPRPVTTYPDPVSVYGFSAGLGWTLMEQFSLDFAYQYRWGEESLKGLEYEIKEQFFVASLIKYF
jgi:long-subunit fatty acid transport protein